MLASWRGQGVSVRWGWPTGRALVLVRGGGGEPGGRAGRRPGPDYEIPEGGTGEGAEGVWKQGTALGNCSRLGEAWALEH